MRSARAIAEGHNRPAGVRAGALLLVAVGLASAAHQLWPALPLLVVAVCLGVLMANLRALDADVRGASHRLSHVLLRVGVVLLGFRLALGDLTDVGLGGALLIVGLVAAVFGAVFTIGRALGVSPQASFLVAGGFAICGASAVAALSGVVDAEEEETTVAIALVTLCGSLSIVMFPVLARLLGIDGADYGTWVGLSVHDVGQVVAASSPAGSASLAAAVLTKLSRVVLLAPLLTVVAVVRRRRGGPGEGHRALVPVFVVGFLAAVVVRSLGVLTTAQLDGLRSAESVALAAALFGLGLGVDVRRLRIIGPRPLVHGLFSWVVVAGLGLGAASLLQL